ncbi:MAG: DUF4349 domain-containing protein, partial [Acidimicrobiales bacterium]
MAKLPAAANNPLLRPAAGAPAASGSVFDATHTGASQGALGQHVVALAPLVIRTGNITLGVGRHDVVAVFNKISTAAITLGGFVESSSNGAGSPVPLPREPQPVVSSGASLVVRVPTDRFALLEEQVDGFGRVKFQQITGTDVTGQSINLQARIKNLDTEETSLRALMARSGSIPDILTVQNELFSVEGEIEALSAEESSLLNRTTYATLSVSIEPAAPVPAPVHKPRPSAVVRALRLAGQNSVVALRSVALAIGWAFPIMILAGIAGLTWL